MSTDAQILQTVQAAFNNCPRPEHFTDYTHCLECAEHDKLLQSRDLHSLSLEDVGDACWSPLCFMTPEGFAYYFPALVRLIFINPEYPYDWPGTMVLSDLSRDGRQNQRFLTCSSEQRAAIASFLRHLIETRSKLVAEYSCTDQLLQALEIWSKEIAPPS